MATIQEQLQEAQDLVVEVNAAISEILRNGQSVSVAGQTYSKSQIASLRILRNELKTEIADLSGGGSSVNLYQGRKTGG